MDNTYVSRLKLIHDRLTDALGELNWDEKIRSLPSSASCFADITVDALKKMLEEEKVFDKNESHFCELVRGELTQDAMIEAGKLAGILPGEEVPLFRHWVKCVADITEWNHLGIALRSLADLCTDGHLIDYPIAERVIQQPYRRYYYRGECRRYPSGVQSIYRGIKPDSMELFARLIKMNEACFALDRIKSVMNWNNTARVDYVAICQHYGLRTMLLDITSSLKTALFFACTRWENGKWRPVNEEDIRESKHGYLYVGSREIFDIELCLGKCRDFVVLPVGHQPMMRCESQYAYTGCALNAGEFDIYQDAHFTAYRFEHSLEFANWIFELCGHGEDIYPGDDIPHWEEYLKKLNDSMYVQKWLIEDFVSRIVPDGDQGWRSEKVKTISDALKKDGYGITEDRDRFLTEEQIAEMERSVMPEPEITFRPLMNENDLLEMLKSKSIPDYFWDYGKKE